MPQDFAVALASHLIDGGVVVKALLILGLWLAGWGAARLVAAVLPDAGSAGQFVAITWRSGIPMSPNGFCRGTGACWSATAACRGWLRRCWRCDSGESGGRGFFALVFWVALAGLTPTGLMLAARWRWCASRHPVAAGRGALRRVGLGRRVVARCRG